MASPWNPEGSASKASVRSDPRADGKKDDPAKLRASTWHRLDSSADLEEPLENMHDRCTFFLEGERMEQAAGILIMLNFLVIVLETDFRSVIKVGIASQPELDAAAKSLTVLEVVNNVFLGIYSVECIVRLAILRLRFFSSSWNLLDLVLLIFGWTSFVLEILLVPATSSMLRVLRMIRLLRLSRVFVGFRELRTLIWGLTQCMKTLFWATGLIFLTLTVWSIVAVEYVTPVMVDIDYGACTWCTAAFQNVMTSNLTFFQIISGDGWSTLARPIIDLHPWTAPIFVSVILVVCFGLLNLIIAAIVDTAAQAREADVEVLAECAMEARDEAWKTFHDLCAQLDTDKDGEICLEELREGLKRDQRLRDYFSVMEVAEEDMVELFELLDEDKSGDLSYEEFHHQLYKMKTLAVKTQLFYVTRYVQHIQRQLDNHGCAMDRMTTSIARLVHATCPDRDLDIGTVAGSAPPSTASVPIVECSGAEGDFDRQQAPDASSEAKPFGTHNEERADSEGGVPRQITKSNPSASLTAAAPVQTWDAKPNGHGTATGAAARDPWLETVPVEKSTGDSNAYWMVSGVVETSDATMELPSESEGSKGKALSLQHPHVEDVKRALGVDSFSI